MWKLATSWLITATSLGLYSVSLSLIGFCTPAGCRTGHEILVLGWMGIGSTGGLAWFANPLMLVAVATGAFGLWYVTAPIGAVALLVGLLTFWSPNVLDNEGGSLTPIVEFGTGYWLWLLSMATFCLTGIAPTVDWTFEKIRHVPIWSNDTRRQGRKQ